MQQLQKTRKGAQFLKKKELSNKKVVFLYPLPHFPSPPANATTLAFQQQQSKLKLRKPNAPMHTMRVPIGSTFQKTFGKLGTFVGTVTKYDPKEDLYMAEFADGDKEELSWPDLHKLLNKSGDTITPLGAKDPGTPEMPAKTTLAETEKAMRSMVVQDKVGGTVDVLIPETQLSPEVRDRDDPTNPDNFRYVGAGLGSAVPPPEKIAVDVENAVPIMVEVRCH